MLSHLILWKSAIAKAPVSAGPVRAEGRFGPVSPATVARLRLRAAANRRAAPAGRSA